MQIPGRKNKLPFCEKQNKYVDQESLVKEQFKNK